MPGTVSLECGANHAAGFKLVMTKSAGEADMLQGQNSRSRT